MKAKAKHAASKGPRREKLTLETHNGRLLCAYCPYCETAWVRVGGEGLFHDCEHFKGQHRVFVKTLFPKIVDMRGPF